MYPAMVDESRLRASHSRGLSLIRVAIEKHVGGATTSEVLEDLARAVVEGYGMDRAVVSTVDAPMLSIDVGLADLGDGWATTLLPLTAGDGRELGTLTLTGELAPGDQDLLALSAAQMSMVLADAADRRARDLDSARQQAVWSVVRASAQHIDLDDVLAAAADALRDGIRCQGVMIRAFDSPSPSSLRRYSASYPPEAEELMSDELLDISGRAARVCWEREEVSSLHIDARDVEPLTTAEERDFMFSLMDLIGARGLLMAPLGGDGECQGWISLTRLTLDVPFDAADEAAVAAIGRELGAAVVHARLFERQRELVEELRELDQYKSQFVATVAHQLKNPLTSVTGHAELLADGLADDSVDTGQLAESVRVIQRGTDRLRQTADSLLTLSKLQDAQHPFAPSLVAMTPLVRDGVDMLRIVADEQGTRLIVDAEADDLVAWGDRGELEKIVDNLLGNAVKYSPHGGAVRVSLRRTGADIVLVCQDQGLGIAPDDIPRLFEAFHRSSDPQALEIPGTGLGMAIVKRVVDRHAGRIRVTSELGVGTRFEITLPAQAPAPA